jgi:transcription termination factor Rho
MVDKIQGFKNACRERLDTFSLMQLRSYGRAVGVDVPTKKKKDELIAEIIAVLAGEVAPIVRSKRGAPVKDERVDPEIEQAIANLRYVWFAGVEPPVRLTYFESQVRTPLVVHASDNSMTFEQYHSQEVHIGQLEIIDGTPCMVDKSGDLSKERLLVSVELIRQYGLREGDIITCHAFEKMGVRAAKNILSINSIYAGTEKRFIFDEEPIVYPYQKIPFTKRQPVALASKYIDYLFPIAYGQRCLVSSAPKSGKSRYLRDIARAIAEKDRDRLLLVLLVGQSPELIADYQRFMLKGDLVATTYEDEAERHVFAAEFLFKRAKRMAEMGWEVVLVVDSLTQVAKAYNETDFSLGGKVLPCGLESKTMHYIKKYFGAGRCFNGFGSLTIIGGVSFGTGDAADDALYSELSSVANAEIRLSEDLARRRVFPAVDVGQSYSECAESLFAPQEHEAEMAFRKRILQDGGDEAARQVLEGSDTIAEFCKKMHP